MQQYHQIVETILSSGVRKSNRTGVDTLSVFNINYSVDLREGFPMLTSKNISWKNIVIENLWFLSGSSEISLLRRHDCRFWEPWADSSGRVPSAYGYFWRQFPARNQSDGEPLDQLRWVVEQLRCNPDSRRLVISAWEPQNAQNSTLPPCHLLWILNVQNLNGIPSLCLHLTQRSCDVALGLPYNIAGYALLLCLLAKISNLQAGIFAHSIVDAHVYTAKADGSMAEYDHLPGLRTQIARKPRALPRLEISTAINHLEDIEFLYTASWEKIARNITLHDYNPYPDIKFKVAV